MKSGVYIITNTINFKVYVGSSSNKENGYNISSNVQFPMLGSKLSDSTKQKISLKLRKNYSFISPDGEPIILEGIKPFCKQHGLDPKSMYKVASGEKSSYKGWRKYSQPEIGIKNKKQYVLLSPYNELFITDNLYSFAKNKNLIPNCLYRVARRLQQQHKGWRLAHS